MANHADVDHRADLFALGVTMFEMLAGCPPFAANLVETLQLNAAGKRPTIRERAGISVPHRLETLVLRLMSPAPADRPASTREILGELATIERELAGSVAVTLNGMELPAANPRPARPVRRGLVVLGLIMAAGSLLAVVGHDQSNEARPMSAAPTSTTPTASASEPPAKQSVPIDPAPTPLAPAPAQLALSQVVPTPALRAPVPVTLEPTSAPATTSAVPARAVESVPRRTTPRPRVARATRPVDLVAAQVVVPAPEAPPERVVDVAPPVEDAPVAPAHAEPKPAPTAPPRPPAKVVTSARVEVRELSVRGALTGSQIRRALSRALPAVRGCYATAASSARRSPSTSLRVSLAIDESQSAHSIRIAGGDLPGLDHCVERALAVVRTEAAPDVGTVDVGLALTFTPDGL